MSNFLSVYDLMGGASSGKAMRGVGHSDQVWSHGSVVDCEEKEAGCLGLTEKNILCGLSIPDQFTGGDWENGLPLSCMAVSSAERPGYGLVNLSNSKQVRVDAYRGAVRFSLKAETGKVGYSRHTGLRAELDPVVLGRIKSVMPNMGDDEFSALPRTSVAEKITQDQDMRHMWMKMYLMLMDLNLAVCARKTKCLGMVGQRQRLYPARTNSEIMGLILKKSIVVNADGLTPEEINVLALSSQAYPCIKFSGKESVYSACNMEADDLAIVSSGPIDCDTRYCWAPSELYRIVVSLAAKFGDIDGLYEVFGMMRGRPSHIRDAIKLIKNRVFYSGVPKSHSYVRALENPKGLPLPSSFPAYIASSVSLVADLLLGSTFELAASFVVEELGGYGKLIGGSSARGESSYHGLLRDFGVSNMRSSENHLMLQWESISGVGYNWAPAEGWKEYLISLTDRMRLGRDVLIPQLTFDLAHAISVDNCWGAIRNWKGMKECGLAGYVGSTGRKKEKDEANRLTACFTWAMGVRQVRPQIYLNAFGAKEVALSSAELHWLAGIGGPMRISNMTYTLDFEYHGREEWTERSATGVIRSVMDGTRCTMVVGSDSSWVRFESSEDQLGRDVELDAKDLKKSGGYKITESLGIDDKEEQKRQDDEIVQMVWKQAKPSNSKEESDARIRQMVGSFRNINMPSKIRLKGSVLPISAQGTEARYDRVEVPGDGTCGIHAVVASMAEMGIVSREERDLVYSNFHSQMNDATYQDASSLAAGLLAHGIAMRVYDVGDSGSCRVIDYGDTSSSNSIAIERRGGHFSAMHMDPKGEISVRVEGIDRGEYNNEQQLLVLQEMNKWFEGSERR